MGDARVQTLTGKVGGKLEASRNYRMITTRAPDTFQRLNYESRIPFNALWESRESISIPVKATVRREHLGDSNLEDAIKTRPRIYMTPSISLDDVKNTEARKTLINFTYNTTSRQANTEVWKDFEPRTMCLLVDSNEGSKPPPMRSIHYLPPGMEKVAHNWDTAQERNIIAEETLRDTVCYNTKQELAETESAEEAKIKQLISANELSIIYDKLPSYYGGFRSREGLGVPLQREELEFSHPNLPVSKAINRYHKYRDRKG